MDLERIVLNFWHERGLTEIPEADLLRDDFIENGFLDSLALVSLIAYLEESLEISFTQEDIQSAEFRNVAGIVKIIQRHLADGYSKDAR